MPNFNAYGYLRRHLSWQCDSVVKGKVDIGGVTLGIISVQIVVKVVKLDEIKWGVMESRAQEAQALTSSRARAHAGRPGECSKGHREGLVMMEQV